MKRLIPLLFLATPALATSALAQQPSPQQQMQQQLDSMVAVVMRVMTTLTSQIASDQAQIETLQKQVQAAAAEKKTVPEGKTP